jgi:hypothetical protein
MKKTILVIAAGFLLSGVGLTSASGAPPVSEHLSAQSSSAAKGHDCGLYPASVVTRTSVTVQRVVQRGQGNTAHVTVTATGDKKPAGSVTLDLVGGGYSESSTLHGGSAIFHLPSGLKLGSYTVIATYSPACGDFMASAGSAAFTVTQHGHHHGHHGGGGHHHHGHHHHGHHHHHGGGHHHHHHHGGGHHHHHRTTV